MSTLKLSLIALGISIAVVLSSFLWWASYGVAETHGFPVNYYSVYTSQIGPVTDFEVPTLAADIILIFIVSLGILTVLRWRALRTKTRRPRI